MRGTPRVFISLAATLLAVAAAMFLATGSARAGLGARFGPSINFTFSLDTAYSTSAGAFTPDGRLVRTIWRNVRYPSGTFSSTWDGTDDSGNPVAGGNYQIRVLYHNVKYDWDGVVGNTSFTHVGDHLWRSFFTLNAVGSLAVSGTTAFLTTGYVEQQARAKRFDTSDPQTPSDAVFTNQEVGWTLVATDGVRYYLANTGDLTDRYSSTFVAGYNVGDGSDAPFSAGTHVITSTPTVTEFQGAVDVSQKDTSGSAVSDPAFLALNAATGLAVQKSGSLLAVAHGPLNVVRLFSKTTGTPVGTISITNPGALAFDANGSLWVLSGTTAKRYVNVGSSPSVAATVTGLSRPINIATHPTNANIVLIADGGTSQQVKAFNASGGGLWTYGLAGGYDTNGPTVANNVFGWTGGRAGLAIQSDGSFWIIDGATNRILHYSSARAYLGQAAFAPGCYCSSADDNNPTRVFVGFLEYSVDYSKALQPGDPTAAGGNGCWKLVRNWAAGIPPAKYFQYNYCWSASGLSVVDTLSNGRTYGLAIDWTPGALQPRQVVELTSNGLRETGKTVGAFQSLYPDGSIRWDATVAGIQTIYRAPLTGFDASNNPVWGLPVAIASYPAGQTPAVSDGQSGGLGGYRFPITSSGILATYNSSTGYNPGNNGANTTGMHLGGVRPGMTDFLWQASPSLMGGDNPFDEKGSFDSGDGITYAGTNLMASGRSIVYGFNGEFWCQSQADQFMHFWDDGLVVGQFGSPGDTLVPQGYAVPGQAGNATNPVMVTARNGETYLYHSDEASHGGLHRWHLSGAYQIREMAGTAALGGSVTLVASASPFPSGLKATGVAQGASLSWRPVPWASSYRIKVATNPGGPYAFVASARGTSATVTGLTNDKNYYFVVSAIVGTTEYANSDEAGVMPGDAAVAVHQAGQAAYEHTNFTTYVVDTSAIYPLQMETSVNLFGNMSQTNLGRGGLYIFDYPTSGSVYSRLPGGASVSLQGGWYEETRPWAKALFRIDGVAGDLLALTTNQGFQFPSTQDAKIDVDPGDSNWHYVTLFFPPTFANQRQFQVVVTPKGQLAPAATQTVSDPINHGSIHVVQFLVKGAVTVTVPAGGLDARLQGIFLDPAN